MGSSAGRDATELTPAAFARSTRQAGSVTVRAVKGGLDVVDPENNDPAVIASAAIAVRIEVM